MVDTPSRQELRHQSLTAGQHKGLLARVPSYASERPGRRPAVREEHRLITRQRLVSATLECFEQKGYLGTTVEDVVAQAGVARGTFYLHFNSKLDVVRELSDAALPSVAALYQRLDALLVEPERGTIRAWMADALHWFESHRTMVTVWQELSVAEPDFVGISPSLTAEHMPRYLAQWPPRLREAARLRVVLLVRQLSGAFLLVRVQRRLDVAEELLTDVLTDLWLTALTPVPGRPDGAARVNAAPKAKRAPTRAAS